MLREWFDRDCPQDDEPKFRFAIAIAMVLTLFAIGVQIVDWVS